MRLAVAAVVAARMPGPLPGFVRGRPRGDPPPRGGRRADILPSRGSTVTICAWTAGMMG